MKDYSAMSDAEINMLVCKQLRLGLSSYCRILSVGDHSILLDDNKTLVDYCNNAADAWPIIYGNLITIEPDYEFIDESEAEVFPTGLWIAERSGNHEFLQHVNESPLRAAMIVYLQMMDGR